MFCNMQIFLDNLKIFLPKRRFIKFECVHHKDFDPIVMIYVIICQQLHVSTQNQLARKADNGPSK